MKNSEEHLNMPDLIKEFKRVDNFHRKIRRDFSHHLAASIHTFYPSFKNLDGLNETFEQLGNHIISATESVIDKDINYPEYRLKEELDNVTSLIEKPKRLANRTVFFEHIHKMTKKLMVKHYPALIDLSGNGFRLLEANALLHVSSFIFACENAITKK